MKKLFMNVLVAGGLLLPYGCSTKTTDTNEKNTEIQDADNQAVAEIMPSRAMATIPIITAVPQQRPNSLILPVLP